MMEELGTVLAYRSEELKKDAENAATAGDIENSGQGSGTDLNGGNGQSSSQTRNRPRRVYSAKKGRPHMGPIIDGRGAGGSGILALCLSSRRNSECTVEAILQFVACLRSFLTNFQPMQCAYMIVS